MPNTVTPLRYPGGKTKFYSYIKNILQSNDLLGQTYIEPFAGGAGLALKLLLNNDVKRIIINDFDPAIYAFWNSILNNSQDFCDLIINTEITPKEWEKQKAIYSRQDTSDLLSLGFATFFLNRTNVSGVIKGGMIGGNNQTGAYLMNARFNKTALIEKIEKIYSFRDKIIISNLDVKEFLNSSILKNCRKVLINFDPPYVRKGAQLYKNSFKEEDHRTLSKLISKCKRKWIVTYDVCPLVAELYDKYQHAYLDVTYSVQGSTKSKEYIFFSNTLTIPNEINLI